MDAGYWILDAGYWMLDTGYWILDTGYWILVVRQNLKVYKVIREILNYAFRQLIFFKLININA